MRPFALPKNFDPRWSEVRVMARNPKKPKSGQKWTFLSFITITRLYIHQTWRDDGYAAI